MFDDAGARIHLSGFPRRSYSPWQAGVKDLGFPVIMISCHNDAAGGECMKKSRRFTGLVLMLLGAMVLLNNLGKPRVEALHGSDVWGLVASGMLLGIGFVGLMGRLSFASSRKDQSRPPRNEWGAGRGSVGKNIPPPS